MFRRSFSLACVALLALSLAGTAHAAAISMDPGSLTIESIFGVGGDFTITFDHGDTADNALFFTASGSGGIGGGADPSAGLAALVFDSTTIINAGDAIANPFDPDNVVNGLVIPGTGIAAALLLDPFAPSSEEFFLQLHATADFFSGVSATLYSLNIEGIKTLDDLHQIDDIVGLLVDSITSQPVRFSTDQPIPEPTAALVFGVGLLITGGAIRRRR